MSDVEEGRAAGKIIAMRVNMDGVQSLRENPEIMGRNSAPLFVYIAPPTLDEAKHRLESRYGLKGEALDAAVEALSEELALARRPVADGGLFDVVLENESTDVAYADLKMLLAAKQPKVGPDTETYSPCSILIYSEPTFYSPVSLAVTAGQAAVSAAGRVRPLWNREAPAPPAPPGRVHPHVPAA
jgi:hypothetical protein